MKKISKQESQTKKINQIKLFQECLRILKTESLEENNKWLMQNKINSYSLRNDKAGDIVNTVNYIFQKVLIAGNISNQSQEKQEGQQYIMFNYLFDHYKSSSKKIIQFCHLIKHFSLWDYQFQFFYGTFLGYGLQKINLYLTCRSHIIQSSVNKYKKTVLSGVMAQIQQWSKLSQNIFKSYEERAIVQEFVEVVKLHYLQVKKNQNERLNGSQFFKICQIIGQRLHQGNDKQVSQKGNRQLSKKFKQSSPTVGEVFKQSLLNGLTMQDRQLVRILSYKDKNIARMLEQKHNKMVNIIGDQVDSLRKDIEIEKRKYLEVIEQKKSLIQMIQRIKKKSLEYVIDNSAKNQEQLLQFFQFYNKKYNPHNSDVQKCKKHVQTKRLLQVIQEQEKML